MPPETNKDKNKLYYGDNLHVLRDYIPSNAVDLIYLDPPFNSRQDEVVSSPQTFLKAGVGPAVEAGSMTAIEA